MQSLVNCRSESTYAQRPIAIFWEGQRLPVARVLAEWHTPQGRVFRLLTEDEWVFTATYQIERDEWLVELW